MEQPHHPKGFVMLAALVVLLGAGEVSLGVLKFR